MGDGPDPSQSLAYRDLLYKTKQSSAKINDGNNPSKRTIDMTGHNHEPRNQSALEINDGKIRPVD